jgi:hypothetical protein
MGKEGKEVRKERQEAEVRFKESEARVLEIKSQMQTQKNILILNPA